MPSRMVLVFGVAASQFRHDLMAFPSSWRFRWPSRKSHRESIHRCWHNSAMRRSQTVRPDRAEETSLTEHRALAELRYQIRRFLRFSEDVARAARIEPQQHQLLLAIK